MSIAHSELVTALARQWLINNDKEGADYWTSVPESDLVGAVRDNLESFGYESQQGCVFILADEPKPITKEQFLAYFMSDAYSEELTVEESIQVFKMSLKGASDITKSLLEELCKEYTTSLETVLEKN